MFGADLRASGADLARWAGAERRDILAHVGDAGKLWIDPATGNPAQVCPFLRRDDSEAARCRIHDDKPDVCRAYPTELHARRCIRGVEF